MRARSCKKCEDLELGIQIITFVGGAQCNLSGREPPSCCTSPKAAYEVAV